MALRRLSEPVRVPVARCQHPEHEPPTMVVLEPGTWEHTCPSCGAARVFTVYQTPGLTHGFGPWGTPTDGNE